MSAVEETQKEVAISAAGRNDAFGSFLSSVLRLLSSVRFGVTLLITLVVLSMIGMLIMQQNVENFDKYFAALTPAQKLIYGKIGFFDIYHAWYFNLLLLVLSLNIVLATIERVPKSWKIARRRKLEAGRSWLLSQQQHAQIRVDANAGEKAAIESVRRAFEKLRLKPIITEKAGRTYIFGDRGWWNRLGYVVVHIALLTIFLGGFLTAQFGRDGQMPLQPGGSASAMSSVVYSEDGISSRTVQLPFTVTCTDIQQKLIRKDGPIAASNTIDWLTWIKIKDETGVRDALVHLNAPYDYRGYRFFQASFLSFGQARTITLRLTPTDGRPAQNVKIKRDGSATLSDGTLIEFTKFQPDFSIGNEGETDSQSSDYNNPAAMLNVTTPAKEQKVVYAFAMDIPDGAPVGAPFGGYKYRMVDFEKVPLGHVLAVQRDPGKTPFYLGGAGLILSLCAVFFFSHQRVWALVERNETEGHFDIFLGGNTNRNKLGFADRFAKLVNTIGGRQIEDKQS